MKIAIKNLIQIPVTLFYISFSNKNNKVTNENCVKKTVKLTIIKHIDRTL